MAFFKVCANPLFGVHHPIGVKYLTRLHVGQSHVHIKLMITFVTPLTLDVHVEVIKSNLLNKTILL